MLYDLLKVSVSVIFNMLNKLLGGKLPPLGSAGVVVEKDDHYLVVVLPRKRVVFPGGFMTWHETPQQAAEREGREETGLKLEVDSFIAFYSLASTGWMNMSTTSFMYHANVVGGELCSSAEGHACWMHIDELRTCITGHSIAVLEDYLRYRQARNDSYAA
jgi:ADP-ribose pyrophosphatase YjhB (NUDIX family)